MPVLGITALAVLACGVFWGLRVPPDARQADAVRILFVHVPAAWTAMLAFVALAIASVGVLVGKGELADVAAETITPLGALFTALGLITGSLWGRPMWGAWWVWDGRLTSFLLLLLIYLGLIALRGALKENSRNRAAKSCAVLAIVGAIDLPVIFFSVQWWTTLHQGSSILRKGGPTMAPVYLYPLLIMALGYTLLLVWLFVVRVRTVLMQRHLAAAEGVL